MASIIPATTSQVVSAAATRHRRSDGQRRPASTRTRIAGNFQTFLTLLTTQLKNQNPLDPLDTNQFTRSSCSSRRSSSSSSRTTSSPRWCRCRRPRRPPPRSNSSARPSASTARPRRSPTARPPGICTVPKPATGTVTIKSATGQTVYTGTYLDERRHCSLRLGRQGRQRPAMARRQLHHLGHRARTPAASRSRCRPRSRRRSIPPISPRTRRCFRSPARTTRSTKSSA